MLFVATTTATTGYYEITGKFWRMTQTGAALRGWLNIGLTLMLLACAAVILGSACMKWAAKSVNPDDQAQADPGLRS